MLPADAAAQAQNWRDDEGLQEQERAARNEHLTSNGYSDVPLVSGPGAFRISVANDECDEQTIQYVCITSSVVACGR